jgi:hypothetical protein
MDKGREGGWSKMPVSWQKDPSFQERIRSAPQGDAIAALKLYIAICLKAEFHPTETLDAGCVQLSLTSLCELVDVSRPMVIAGLKLLAEWGIVRSENGRPTILRIVHYVNTPYWVKLPKRPLYGSKDQDHVIGLVQMPNRRRGTLHALQLYLYLAAIRDKQTHIAKLSYDQGKRTLGLSRNQFSAAISMLTLELVTVRTASETKEMTGKSYSTNQYWLRGSRNDPFETDHVDRATNDLEDWDDVLDDDDDIAFDSVAQRNPPARALRPRPPGQSGPPPTFDDDD